MFVNTLFSFFEATGMETFDEMIVNRRASAERIIDTIKNISICRLWYTTTYAVQ